MEAQGHKRVACTQALTHLKVELDGKEKLELNKVSPTFRVNGKDMLAPIKKLT